MRAIALGAACNNACVFCAQGDLRAEGARVDAAEIEAAIAAVAPGEIVVFQGGEPTLHDALPAWVRAADERGAARIVVQTNGRRLAYEGFVRALRAASPRLTLDVSLHGTNAAMHDYHTGTPGSFEQTIIGLRRARAERIPAALTTVVTRSNFRHLLDLVRIAHTAGARAIHFAFTAPAGRAAEARARLIPAREMVAPYLARAIAEAQRLGIGTLIDDGAVRRASSPEITGLFAGLGVVEPPKSARATSSPRRVSLPLAPEAQGG